MDLFAGVPQVSGELTDAELYAIALISGWVINAVEMYGISDEHPEAAGFTAASQGVLQHITNIMLTRRIVLPDEALADCIERIIKAKGKVPRLRVGEN